MIYEDNIPKKSPVKMVGKEFRDGANKIYIVTGISLSGEPMVSYKEKKEGSKTKIRTLRWFKEHMYSVAPI